MRHDTTTTPQATATVDLPAQHDLDAPEDYWLTLAEIAAELRVCPATVRLWIARGRLPATRPGQRKLLVRRSDVDRMLGHRGRRSQAPVSRGPRRRPRGEAAMTPAAIPAGRGLDAPDDCRRCAPARGGDRAPDPQGAPMPRQTTQLGHRAALALNIPIDDAREQQLDAL